MDFDRIKKSLTDALLERGVSEYEIYYMSSEDVSCETLNKEMRAFNSSNKGGICLRVLVGGRMGYAATELMEESEMCSLAERAVENARYVEKEDTVGIFKGSPEYESFRCKLFTPLDSSALRTLALDTADAVYRQSESVKDGSSTQAASYGFTIRIVNSHGLDLSGSCGVNALACDAVVERDGESESSFALAEITENRDEAAWRVAKEAVTDALAKIGAVGVPSGKYNVIIDGKQMRQLLSVYSSAFSAKRVLDGMSPLKGLVGEKIASDCITVSDDPQREGNSVGTVFDAEGVATKRKLVIDRGVLTTFLHNRETAMEMGTQSTANASKSDYSSPIGIRPHSFCIEAGTLSFDELLKKANNGVYVTALKGLHAGANPITGDFSLESEGFMIRDGKLAEAVKTFTVASNFFELLKSVSALSNEIKKGVATGFTSFGSPDVLIENISIAGD